LETTDIQQSPVNWSLSALRADGHARPDTQPRPGKSSAKLKEIEKTQYVRSYYVAMIYAALGDKDNAFVELEKSLKAHYHRARDP